MSDKTDATLALHHYLYAITIPAAASTAANLADLAVAAGFDMKKCFLGAGIKPCGADYKASTVIGMSPYYTVPTGDSYTEPTIHFLEDTYVKASAGAAIPAVLVVYWK